MKQDEKKILVVDDEAFFREEVADFLSSPRFADRGWTVETAADGAEALEKLEADPADVVLLDINMPGMDGMEVLQQLQERRLLDKVYVIMLSAYGVYENVVESMRRGAKDFVNKSEPLDQWVVRIERGFEWQDLQWRKQRAAGWWRGMRRARNPFRSSRRFWPGSKAWPMTWARWQWPGTRRKPGTGSRWTYTAC